MTMPLTQQPPTATTTQQYYNAYPSRGSVGPVIAVLVVIIILGVLAGMIGRLCSGKRIMGYGQFDMESWAERKFSSCIDGRLSPTLPLQRPPINVSDTSVSTPTPVPTPAHQERKQEEEEEEEQHSSSSNQPTHHM